MRALSLGREEASGVRVGMEGGDGGKRRSRSGSLRPLHNGEYRADEPSSQPQHELITCELCNLSQQEKARRENSSSGSHNSQNNRLVPSRSQWEEREESWLCLKQKPLDSPRALPGLLRLLSCMRQTS